MVVFVYALFLPTILVMVPWKKPRTPRAGSCTGCGYSLANLPEGSICPECGTAASEHESRFLEWSRNYSDRKRRLGRIYVAIPVAIVIASVCLHIAVAAAYWWDGFGFMRGWELTPQRELARSRPSAIVLLIYTLPLVPFFAFMRRRSLRWAICALSLIAVAVWIKAAYFAY